MGQDSLEAFPFHDDSLDDDTFETLMMVHEAGQEPFENLAPTPAAVADPRDPSNFETQDPEQSTQERTDMVLASMERVIPPPAAKPTECMSMDEVDERIAFLQHLGFEALR